MTDHAPDRTSPPFDFSKLKARWEHEREDTRNASERLLAQVRLAATPILQAYGATRAYLFGSIPEGRAGVRSDVDLLVLGVGSGAYWDLRHDLEQALGRPLEIAAFFKTLRQTAEQLTPLQRWYRVLSRALAKYLNGRELRPPLC